MKTWQVSGADKLLSKFDSHRDHDYLPLERMQGIAREIKRRVDDPLVERKILKTKTTRWFDNPELGFGYLFPLRLYTNGQYGQ